MKEVKNILLIVIYAFLMPIAFVCATANKIILGIGIYDSWNNSFSDGARDLMWMMCLPASAILAGMICSIPIWFIDYKSKDERIIRQIIAVTGYVVIILLGYWVLFRVIDGLSM